MMSSCAQKDVAEAAKYSNRKAQVEIKFLVNSDISLDLEDQTWGTAEALDVEFIVSTSMLSDYGQYKKTIKGNYNQTTGIVSATIPVGAMGAEFDMVVKDFKGTVTRLDDEGEEETVNVLWYGFTEEDIYAEEGMVVRMTYLYNADGTEGDDYDVIDEMIGVGDPLHPDL